MMKFTMVFILLILLVMLPCGTGFAIDSEKDGCMKISFSSLPIFGDSEKDGESRAEYVDDATDKEKYTYNAMGQKVPTRTERSGDASPIH
jgi:hypothetical protein